MRTMTTTTATRRHCPRHDSERGWATLLGSITGEAVAIIASLHALDRHSSSLTRLRIQAAITTKVASFQE